MNRCACARGSVTILFPFYGVEEPDVKMCWHARFFFNVVVELDVLGREGLSQINFL